MEVSSGDIIKVFVISYNHHLHISTQKLHPKKHPPTPPDFLRACLFCGYFHWSVDMPGTKRKGRSLQTQPECLSALGMVSNWSTTETFPAKWHQRFWVGEDWTANKTTKSTRPPNPIETHVSMSLIKKYGKLCIRKNLKSPITRNTLRIQVDFGDGMFRPSILDHPGSGNVWILSGISFIENHRHRKNFPVGLFPCA